MNIEEYLIQRKREVDDALDRYLPKGESLLIQAMRYSVFSGGKRIRPILTLATGELAGGKKEDVLLAACAIELIHTFTLIHDDLPCMDDDDYRRGKLASHRVYTEGIAVLAGDALLNYGFKLILEGSITNKFSPGPEIAIWILNEICEAIGLRGMVGGQAEDLLLENKKVDLFTLKEIYKRKTAALFCVSVKIGAILGTVTDEELFLLSEYGKHIGLAFQIVDDILEVTQESKQIKKVKPTYVSLVGVEEAKRIAQEEIHRAKEKLNIFGLKAEVLSAIADYIVQRIS